MQRRGLLCATLLLTACSNVSRLNEQSLLLESSRAAAKAAKPLTLPVVRTDPSEYEIGPRDLLEIDIYELEAPSQTKKLRLRVSQTGEIVLPLIGAVQAAGRTVSQVQASIEERLARDFIHDPSVSVLIDEFKSRRVTILGEVEKPGPIELSENSTTLINAIAMAGGVTEDAGSKIFILRAPPVQPAEPETPPAKPGGSFVTGSKPTSNGQQFAQDFHDKIDDRLIQIDLTDLVENGNLALNCALQDGDLVHIPKATMCFVTGHVHYPGGFPARGDVTLLKAIAMAGGARDTATPRLTVLLRITPEGRKSIPIDLTKVKAGTDSDILMQPGDVLVLNQSTTSRIGRAIHDFFRGLFTIGYAIR